jgi:hypothetical protein
VNAIPLTRKRVNAYIEEHHRHHGRVAGYRFAFGALLGGQLVGACVVGRPKAGQLEQYETAEVTRLCADGTRNVCSFLYSKASRVCRELGFARVFTYILESESGDSLKAAGWVHEYDTRGGSWDRVKRPRVDKAPTCRKQCWAPAWCAMVKP